MNPWAHFIILLALYFALAELTGTGVDGMQTFMLGYLLFDKIRENDNQAD